MTYKQMFSPSTDGMDHVNVYHNSKSPLGVFLAPTYTVDNGIVTEDGIFSSVSAYWYFLSTGDEVYRKMEGMEAKKYSKKHMKKSRPLTAEDKLKLTRAEKFKIMSREYTVPELVVLLDIPLTNYYIYNGKPFYPGTTWFMSAIKSIIKELSDKWDVDKEHKYSLLIEEACPEEVLKCIHSLMMEKSDIGDLFMIPPDDDMNIINQFKRVGLTIDGINSKPLTQSQGFESLAILRQLNCVRDNLNILSETVDLMYEDPIQYLFCWDPYRYYGPEEVLIASVSGNFFEKPIGCINLACESQRHQYFTTLHGKR